MITKKVNLITKIITMKKNKTIEILGYHVLEDGIDYSDILKSKNHVVTCINPEAYWQAEKDINFQKALINSNYLLVDGVGIKMAAKYIYGNKIKRYTGPDFHQDFLKFYDKNGGGRIFYMGSSVSTLNKISEKINKLYSNIIIETHSPPFKKEFSLDDILPRGDERAPYPLSSSSDTDPFASPSFKSPNFLHKQQHHGG